jgi:hypothetical protein
LLRRGDTLGLSVIVLCVLSEVIEILWVLGALLMVNTKVHIEMGLVGSKSTLGRKPYLLYHVSD